MNENIGRVKLYHRSGAKVSLPVNGQDAAAMHAAVDAYLAAGFAVNLPGMEPGEHREEVSHVVRGRHSKDGKTTPYVLLYSPKPELKHAFLKVYLNTESMVFDFEYASKLRLGNIPVYVGKDKPERGVDQEFDREFMVAAPKPFSVLFKDNPKYSAEDAAKTPAGQVYPIPKRVFVRWADQRSDGEQPATQGKPFSIDFNKLNENSEAIREKWKKMMGSNPPVDAWNAFAAANWNDVPQAMRDNLNAAIRGFASKNGWTWDGSKYVGSGDNPDDIPF